MSQVEVPELMLSCWIIETARSSVLADRGRTQAGVRAAERARILARGCLAEGVKLQPSMAGRHAEWMAGVAGSEAETGALGWMFLQRIGMYVEAHIRNFLPPAEHERMLALSEPDIESVNEALVAQGLPDIPKILPSADSIPAGFAGSKHLIGVVADPHINPDDNETFCQAVDELNYLGVQMTVVPGDLTRDAEPESYAAARKLIANSTAPIVATLGNHDVAPSGSGESKGPERFEKALGGKTFGVYEAAGARLIVLNSAVPEISPFPPFDILGGDFTKSAPDAVPWGSFSPAVEEWMRGLGPASAPTFIFLHHPPYPYLGFPPLVFGLTKDATAALSQLAERTQSEAIFCGHTHRSALSYLDGVPVIEVPSNRHWPFGYGVLRIQPGDAKWSFNVRTNPNPPESEPNDYAGYIFRRYAGGEQIGMSYSSDPAL